MTQSTLAIRFELTPSCEEFAVRLWHRCMRWTAGLVVAVVVVAATWYATSREKLAVAGSPGEPQAANGPTEIIAEVVAPRPGGIDRICNQPGTIEPYEAADLYSK